MSDFRPAKRRVEVSVGDPPHHAGLAGAEPEPARRIDRHSADDDSAIENGRVRLGVERAKVLARALKCHPAVLVFPGWSVDEQTAA